MPNSSHSLRIIFAVSGLIFSQFAAAATPKNCNYREEPWVLATPCGETYLADIFYADEIQNEQVMPLKVRDKHVAKAGLAAREQIKHLVYPTIGNPNLYTKSDAEDSLTLALRLEWNQLKDMKPGDPSKEANRANTPNSTALKYNLVLDQTKTAIRFFLVDRVNRPQLVQGKPFVADAKKGIFEIKPSRFLQRSQKGYPEAFKKFYRFDVDFNQASLAQVPAGFYDIRFEITDGKSTSAYEYQYNAVRVFNDENDNYSIVNVTDSQLSVSQLGESIIGKSFATETKRKLEEFVNYISAVMSKDSGAFKPDSSEAKIRNAAFITFNGDLHNGGAPGPTDVLPETVAWTYQQEAEAIINILMELKLPIFLTAGNHDGYANMGHVPAAIRVGAKVTGQKSLQEVVMAANPKAWPRFSQFLAETKDTPGGRKLDILTGAFVRLDGAQGWTKQLSRVLPTFEKVERPGKEPHYQNHRAEAETVETWQEVPEAERNFPLYDGFNQWRKTYGPLYSSWRFGKNLYVNLNTYDCHQHRRSGWGMYTVNYGGCVSDAQMFWFNHQYQAADKQNLDTVVIGHHDPRGGHKGEARPFYFEQIDYNGAFTSLKNYAVGEVLRPKVCPIIKNMDTAALNTEKIDCYNDGLQEWMLPDKDFGCKDDEKLESGMCNQALFDDTLPKGVRRNHRYTGYELVHWFTKVNSIRTVLLGHTHYNAIEMLAPGSALVPDEVILSSKNDGLYKTHMKLANEFTAAESSLPSRVLNRVWSMLGKNKDEEVDEKEVAKAIAEYKKLGVERKNLAHLEATALLFGPGSKHQFDHKIGMKDEKGNLLTPEKELAFIRTVSVSSLSSQEVFSLSAPAFGFTVFDISSDHNRDGYTNPTISAITYFRNLNPDDIEGSFEAVEDDSARDRNPTLILNRNVPKGYTILQDQGRFRMTK